MLSKNHSTYTTTQHTRHLIRYSQRSAITDACVTVIVVLLILSTWRHLVIQEHKPSKEETITLFVK